MATMGELEDRVYEAMKEPGQSAEEQIERRVDSMVREFDELCALATNAETIDLVQGQAIGIGQCAFRANLILSFLEARKVPKFKLVQNIR